MGTNLQDWAKANNVDLDQAREAVRRMRGNAKAPPSQANLSDQELETLSGLKEEGLTAEPGEESNPEQVSDLKRRIAELEAKVQEAEAAKKRDAESRTEEEQALAKRLGLLEQSIRGDATNEIQGTRTIEVKRGDLIKYDTRLKHDLIVGGWVKATENDEVSRAVPIVSVCEVPFSYDERHGAPYHAVRQSTYKRYFQKTGPQVVGEPRPRLDPKTGRPPRNSLIGAT